MAAQLPQPTNERTQTHIFISYSSKDRPFVGKLAEELHTNGYRVWVDNVAPEYQGIRVGEAWQQALANAINQAAVVTLVVSPESVCSEWVQAEIRRAGESGKTVTPMLIRPMETDEDHAAKRCMDAIPINGQRLGDLHYLDFHRFGYPSEFSKLLADLKKYIAMVSVGVLAHCRALAAKLMQEAAWGMEHYIQEEARILPVHASPYEDGGIRGAEENLLGRLWTSSRLIVLGEPGIGKTVALERLAWELARCDPLIVPIPVKLLAYDGQPLLEWVRVSLKQTGEIQLRSMDAVREFLDETKHDCYFLLDGLNEVRPAHREQIVGEINRLALEYPRHRIVVTSRVQDDSWRDLRESGPLQETVLVRPIRQEQARNYLAAHLGLDNGGALWEQLDAKMRELAQTPLLLWLIKEAWQEGKEIDPDGNIRVPDNRGGLYRSFVTKMLRREDKLHLSKPIPDTQRIAACERLALALHREKALTLPRDVAQTIVGDEATLMALLVNGLLIPTGENELRFAPHQTVQEHFAARALLDSVMGKAQASRITRKIAKGALKHADDPWWAETFIQMAGLTDDPDTLAIAIADSNPWLAWWCAQDGKKVNSDTEEAIRKRSEALVRSSKVADRRRAAQALARMQSPRVIEPLVKLAGDIENEIGNLAAKAVSNFGDAAIPMLLPALIDITIPPKGRARIGRVLGELGDPRPGVGVVVVGTHGRASLPAPRPVPDIVWCDIAPGEFLYVDEKEKIDIPYAYQISKYPITNAQFQPFIDADQEGYNNPVWWTGTGWQWKGERTAPDEYDNPDFRLPNHPRIYMRWYEAFAFCNWLTALLYPDVWAAYLTMAVGTPYMASGARRAVPLPEWPQYATFPGLIRLPTEREWERAARGTDGRIYPWGDEWDASKCNSSESGIGQTSAVGLFPDGQSPYGALDMAGNVWEWCLTEYDTKDDSNINTNNVRVLRGGSWDNDGTTWLRAAVRIGDLPGGWDLYRGVRVARS